MVGMWRVWPAATKGRLSSHKQKEKLTTMVIRRIGPLSLAKISGVLYGLMGLLFGALLSLFSLVGTAFTQNNEAPFVGMLFGVGAIIALPLFYGILGFVMALIGAALYNLVAGFVGGMELEIESGAYPEPYRPPAPRVDPSGVV